MDFYEQEAQKRRLRFEKDTTWSISFVLLAMIALVVVLLYGSLNYKWLFFISCVANASWIASEFTDYVFRKDKESIN